jgi:subtilisin family serine protease
MTREPRGAPLDVDLTCEGTGRGVRIAIVDSGVHAAHPHVRGVAGGIGISPDGGEQADFVDRLGHGTAVTAAIREKAPDAELFAVKVFDRALTTDIRALVGAIDWAIGMGARLVNLSLGTSRPEHEARLEEAVERAGAAGVVIVAAREDQGIRWLPGSLRGVLGVQVSWDCPRDRYRAVLDDDGRVTFGASGYPREIPGVPPERNLKGISFAVANMTGFAARVLERMPGARFSDLIERLSSPGIVRSDERTEEAEDT